MKTCLQSKTCSKCNNGDTIFWQRCAMFHHSYCDLIQRGWILPETKIMCALPQRHWTQSFCFQKNMFIHVALNGEIFWTCGNSQIGIRFEPPYVKPTTGTPETQAHWFGRFPKEASSFQLHSCVGIDANAAQKIKLRFCRRHDSWNALSNCDLAAMFAGKKQGWLNYVALLDTTCWVVMFNLNRIWHHKKNWYMHTHFYPM